MLSFKNILIYHAGAIGDTVLSTPVAALLRKHYADAHIAQISHSANLELLALGKNVDSFLGCDPESGWAQQRRYVAELKPDLIVDLSSSLKSFLITRFHNARLLRYCKYPAQLRPIEHAVDNFLATLKPIGLAENSHALFPTLSITPQLSSAASAKVGRTAAVIACVPGVGKLRSHRAWSSSNWVGLINALLKHGKFPVLVGGADDSELCQQIASAANVLNLAGSLSLCETAAVLELCDLAVSCDTGPAHIAVAVGTPVIGLHGPTYVQRSGPYGCLERCVSATDHCCCMALKSCSVTGKPGPGYCMDQISVDEVLNKVLQTILCS